MFYPELAKITKRLDLDCFGARLDAIIDNDDKIQLSFYPPQSGGKIHIVIDFSPKHLDLYVADPPLKAPQTPRSFTMLLRKHLLSKRLAALRLSKDDRILNFEFNAGDTCVNELVIELTGYKTNVFLVDAQNGQILGQISNDETRMVGGIYNYPQPAQNLSQVNRFQDIPNAKLYTELARYFRERDAKEYFDARQRQLQNQLKKLVTRLEKRCLGLDSDRQKAELTLSTAYEADLLNAYAHLLSKGQTQVELERFDTGKTVSIALDPQKSPRENIDARYHLQRRAKRSLSYQTEQRTLTQSQLDSAQEALALVEAAQDFDSLNQAQAEIQRRYPEISTQLDKGQQASQLQIRQKQAGPPPRLPTSTSKADREHKPYRIFSTLNGLEIRVGKSAKDNDELTFRHVRGNDTWLHVAEGAGSHVVLRSAEPDGESLLDAASLAIHYSKLSKASSAEVHVTQAKYIRRIKGAPPGKVNIRVGKVLFVKMEEARLKRLLSQNR